MKKIDFLAICEHSKQYHNKLEITKDNLLPKVAEHSFTEIFKLKKFAKSDGIK